MIMNFLKGKYLINYDLSFNKKINFFRFLIESNTSDNILLKRLGFEPIDLKGF
jgi:hypothetical protein